MKTSETALKATQGVVSVKLDRSTQEQVEKAAAESGLTKSDYIRKLLNEAKSESEGVKPQTEVTAIVNQVQACNLTDESLATIANLVSKVIKDAIPAPVYLSPERDLLTKLANKEPEGKQTLTNDEETYLKTLNEANRAELLETLLTENNSVPMYEMSEIQKRVFNSMVLNRGKVVSEKIPSLTKLFQIAIERAFAESAKALYNAGLFKATYGIEYAEFKAVFLEE